MTLVVQWWLFLPFDTRGRVIFLCRVTFHSAHFTSDRHWDHIPILLQYCGSCPCVRHDPYLPSISASLQTPGRAELATILTIPLLFQGLSPLSFTLSSQSSGSSKNSTLSVTTSLPTPAGILPRHTNQDPCLLSILVILPPLSSLPDPNYFFNPRACQTLGSRHPPRPLEIRVCQTLTPHQSILQDES